MEYRFERVEPIREHDEYANWLAHISVLYGRMNPPVKIDITTGDSITPAQIEYPYPRMFDEGCIAVMSYPMATTLAEKFETVVSRGTANTRGRDFYDILALLNAHEHTIDFDQIRSALDATSAKRGSADTVVEYAYVLENIRSSPQMISVWDSYAKATPYAENIAFDTAIEASLELGRRIFSR